MKNFTTFIFAFLLLQTQGLIASDQASSTCGNGAALDVINGSQSKFIAGVQETASMSGCHDTSVLVDITNPNYRANHDQLRCAQVDMCLAGKSNFLYLKEAQDIVKDNLPKAILLSILGKDIDANLEFNLELRKYERNNNYRNVCGDEKVEAQCEKNIRNALAQVSYAFDKADKIRKAQGDDESLFSYVGRTLLGGDRYKETPIIKFAELKKGCSKKINFNNICNKSKARAKEIATCEKNKKNCLNNEQTTLDLLLNNYKSSNENLFLTMEKELCSPSRIMAGPLVSTVGTSTHEGRTKSSDSVSKSIWSSSNGDDDDSNFQASKPDPAKVVVDVQTGLIEGINSGSKGVSSNQKAKVENEVIVDADSVNGKSLTDEFVNNSTSALEGYKGYSNLTTPQNINAFNSVNAGDLDKNAITANGENKDNLTKDEKKKKDDLDALMTQIDDLKDKLADMTKKVEVLKEKKDESPEAKADKEKEEKESVKAIAELKSKLVALQEEKKKKELDMQMQARQKEEERIRSEAPAKSAAAFSIGSDYSRSDAGRVEQAKSAQNYAPSSVTANESRAPASVSSAIGNVSANSNIVLSAAGGKQQSSSESNTVYMTADEVKNYPYRLDANATDVDIEKMLAKMNGETSILIGNDEQIIPVKKDGKIEYKRVKISLVKNEKDKKAVIAREISSAADLKLEEQKKRDLIRYQEMKNTFKALTDK